MKSLFGEHKQKVIPSSLQDCTKMDSVSKSLWQWAKNLEMIALILFWLNAVAGLIVGIGLGADAYDDGFLLFMAGFLGGLFAGVLAYLAFFVAALLVGSLASIVENTRVSADVALFEAAKANGGVGVQPLETAEQVHAPEKLQIPAVETKQEETVSSTKLTKNMLAYVYYEASNNSCSECGKKPSAYWYRRKDTNEIGYLCKDCANNLK